MSALSRLIEAGEHEGAVPKVALALRALAVAEVLTALFEPRVGLVLHGVLLVLLLLHTALTWEHPSHGLLLSRAFAPLIRLLSLSLPLAGVPLVYWYFITSVPLFIAAVIALRTLGFSWAGTGVNLRALPIQVLVGLTGLAFGYIEYQILEPEPLAKAFTWEQLWLAALILLVSTGFAEELIFRGLMQRAASEALGRIGVLYVAVLFAVLHVGYKSLADVLFVFGVALFFGWVVARTRSILGVTLSHGLTNIVLFLVVPFLPLINPPPTQVVPKTLLPPAAGSTSATAAPATSTTEPTSTFTAPPQATATATPATLPTATPRPTVAWIPTPTRTAIAQRPPIALPAGDAKPSRATVVRPPSPLVPTAPVTPTPPPCGPPDDWVQVTVLPGETLYRLSLRYATTVAQLQQANCMDDPDILLAYQLLWVPPNVVVSPTARPTP